MVFLVIDTDIGSDIDDALALLLAFHLTDVNILGITTVYGDSALRAKIACKIVQAAGLDIPIAAGIEEPQGSPLPIWYAGTEGQGVLTPEEVKAPLSDFSINDNAVDLLIETVLAQPGKVTVVALGALTNIAQAIDVEPRFATALGELVFMGGSIVFPGEWPASLELSKAYCAGPSHNIRCDVVAARKVLAAGVPMRIVTNDATRHYWLDGPPIERFRTASHPAVRIVGDMLEIWLEYRSQAFGRPIRGTCPHDPLTLAVACHRVKYESVRGTFKIFDDGDTEFQSSNDSHLEFVVREHGNRFLPWLIERLFEKE